MEDLWSDPPSDKARMFVEELAALCERHGVALSAEGYDALQVWDRKPEDGGPIIERERIAPQPERRGDIGNEWADQPEPALGWEVHVGGRTITGPTYLIAAMRAFCASRFGEFVELP
jgi:hypothetical protein